MLNSTRSLRLSFAVAAAVIAFLPAGHAAAIVWDTPTTLGGDTDVLTTGSLVSAFNFGLDGGTTTVNGVAFQNVTNPDYGSTTWAVGSGTGSLAFAGHFLFSGDFFDVGQQPYSLLSAGYRSLLSSAMWNDFGSDNTIAVTLAGLTVGQQYYLQLWTNDSRDWGVNRDTSFTTAASVVLEQNTGSGYGGLGQWVVGTFTADATTQQILASSNAATMINALQLRSATAIPEPSTTAALSAAIVLGAAFLWRRGRRAA